jgi:erythromycin esterase
MNISIRILLFLILFVAAQSKSQNQPLPDALQAIGNEIKSIDPANIDFSDLQFLKKTIGSSRIILLGEQTHGEGATFSAKIRMIKFLHEKMGFNVLAFESGLYDCAKIWDETKKGKPLKSEVTGSLFYMYATSEQMYPLFDYIQKNITGQNELQLTGFESQLSGKKSIDELFKDLFVFFDQQHIRISTADKALVERLSISNFKSNPFNPTEEEQRNYFALINQWKELIKSNPVSGKTLFECSGFWFNTVSSIASQAERYWKMKNDFAENFNVRDKQMAANFIWLADTFYKNEKIIVWAHNVHIAKNTAGLTYADTNATAFFSALKPFGHHLKTHYGNKAYMVGFTANKGRYTNFENDKIIDLPEALPGTLEDALKHKGNYYFIDFNQAAQNSSIRQQQRSRIGDFTEAKANWSTVFDGMFFIEQTFPVIRKSQ